MLSEFIQHKKLRNGAKFILNNTARSYFHLDFNTFADLDFYYISGWLNSEVLHCDDGDTTCLIILSGERALYMLYAFS